MELRQESLSNLRELLRRAGTHPTTEEEDDYRHKPQHGVDAPPHSGAVIAQENAKPGLPREVWSGTLDLVLRASEKLVASEERVRGLEAEVRELTEMAALEIQQLRAEIADLQRKLHDAEAGRRHAEDWLRRLNDAVRERFTLEAAQDREAPAAHAS
jgi:hypothetical protein